MRNYIRRRQTGTHELHAGVDGYAGDGSRCARECLPEGEDAYEGERRGIADYNGVGRRVQLDDGERGRRRERARTRRVAVARRR